MSANVTNEITNLLNDFSSLSEGLGKQNSAEVVKAVEALIGDIQNVIDHGGETTKEFQAFLNDTLSKFKNDKDPISLVNDLINLKEEMNSVYKSFYDLENQAQKTMSNTEELFGESRGLVKGLVRDFKGYFKDIVNNNKGFVDELKMAFHDAKNKTSPHHGVGHFTKSVAKDAAHLVENDFHSTEEFLHHLISSNDTQKLVGFAEGILEEVQKESVAMSEPSSTPMLSPSPEAVV